MKASFCTLLLLLSFSAAAMKDTLYYFKNPQALQTEVSHCEQQPGQGGDCDKISRLANEYSIMVYELRESPQAFGVRILKLQNEILQLLQDLKGSPKDQAMQEDLSAKQTLLSQRLALVKTYESPEG